MQFTATDFPGLYVVEPKVFRDERGFFLETYRADLFRAHGLARGFTQANHARSEHRGVLRGLHFQRPPMAQAKLVWVTRGEVLDVVLDIRRGSPTYGKWFSSRLGQEDFRRLLIPAGFAHGYLTLTPGVEFQYMVDNYYSPEHDAGVLWNDPDLGIDWPEADPVLSPKDRNLPRLRDLDSPFEFQG